MILSQIIKEFSQYYTTQDYLRGVLVEITGIAIEVLFLSIAIPIILSLVRYFRTRPIRLMADFYLFQIFHKITRMFLDMAAVTDIMPILLKEMEKDDNFRIFSHYIYGNLENILFVLKKTFSKTDTFCRELEKKSLDDFIRYQSIVCRCLDEIDRLATILVGLPKLQKELFSMRILVYPLRDIIEERLEDLRTREHQDRKIHPYDVKRMADQITGQIKVAFLKRRKLIDSTMKYRTWFSNFLLIASLPYVLLRRFIALHICRLRKKPYRDFIYPSSAPDILRTWRTENGIGVDQAANIIGVSQKVYREYELGYKEPDKNAWTIIHSYRFQKTNEN